MTRLYVIILLLSLVSCDYSVRNTHKYHSPAYDESIGSVDVDSERVLSMTQKMRTSTDPAYIYEFSQTRFVPPPGKTLLIVGQDIDVIDDYTDYFEGQPLPGGLMAYWAINGMAGVDRDNAQDIAAQFGRQNHQLLVNTYPDTVLQSGLWIVGMWQILEQARQDKFNHVIRDFSRWLKTIDRPLYLRIGYEFDGAHNELDPEQYKIVYRKIVDIMRAEGVENVAFVWHSYAAPAYNGYPLAAWYPGDAYVDWVGISLFGHLYGDGIGDEADIVLEFARQHKKPVMIAESSPIEGIHATDLDAWNTWFVNLFSLVHEKNIKALSFINANWQAYPGFMELAWKDARLQNNPAIAAAWLEHISRPRYLKQSDNLYESLGYNTGE